MTKVLAVSGGVDSVVMLDLLVKHYSSGDIFLSEKGENYAKKADFCGKNIISEIIAAHFDHGMRENSQLDGEFVQDVAERLGVRFVSERAELGVRASEEAARTARYEFFQRVAREQGAAEIYTAHHLDDLVETVAINLVRGTGWRGLACLDAPGVRRPLLEGTSFDDQDFSKNLPEGDQVSTCGSAVIYEPMDKAAILEYAAKRGLHFREDPTNSSPDYLRNRIRAEAEGKLTSAQKLQLWQLWQRQKQLKREIDDLVTALLPAPDAPWQRAWFNDLDASVALELLRAGTLRAGVSATRPQLENFRQAILTYAPGKQFNLPGDHLVKIGRTEFYL